MGRLLAREALEIISISVGHELEADDLGYSLVYRCIFYCSSRECINLDEYVQS